MNPGKPAWTSSVQIAKTHSILFSKKTLQRRSAEKLILKATEGERRNHSFRRFQHYKHEAKRRAESAVFKLSWRIITLRYKPAFDNSNKKTKHDRSSEKLPEWFVMF